MDNVNIVVYASFFKLRYKDLHSMSLESGLYNEMEFRMKRQVSEYGEHVSLARLEGRKNSSISLFLIPGLCLFMAETKTKNTP